MTATTQNDQEKRDLEVRLGAQMFLAESGWRCRIDAGQHKGEPVEVYVAFHDSYPEQRAITVSELVKRCVWQEAYRYPRKKAQSDAL